MSPLTVAAAPGAEGVATGVLSSLPVSFAPVTGAAVPDLSVIAGAAGWAGQAAAALRRGSTAVVVIHAQPEDLVPLVRLGDPPVVFDHVWAGNPAVGVAAAHFAEAAAQADLLECRLTVGDDDRSVRAVLVDAAVLIRDLVGPLSGVTVLHHNAAGFVADSAVGDLAVSISVQRTTALAPHAYVRLLTHDGGIEIAIPHPKTARPAEIVITDLTGIRTLPTIWESAHRAAWRLARDLLDHSVPVDHLATFAADQEQLRSALDTLAAPDRSNTAHAPIAPLNEESATTSD